MILMFARSSVVPLGVTIINSALPKVLKALTDFEKWDDSGFRIKAKATRVFMAKMLNILIQIYSYALLLDPYLSMLE